MVAKYRGGWIISPDRYEKLGSIGKMYTIVGGPAKKPNDAQVIRVVLIETSTRAQAKLQEASVRRGHRLARLRWHAASLLFDAQGLP